MRNGQNNKNRLRNRNNHGGSNHNNNNRRSQNPLTRVFESNGPDIKIRGTASHIAEKYVQLARDARTSGDPVASENYYQHAEHYFRLIAAAQEQFRQNQPQPRDGEQAPVNAEESGEDEGENFSHFGAEPGFVPMQHQPREQNFQPRESNFQPREQREHQPREHRPQPNFQQPPPVALQPGEADVGALPSFITGGQPGAAAPFEGAAPQGEGRERFPRRRRRPHGPRPDAVAQPVPAGDDA